MSSDDEINELTNKLSSSFTRKTPRHQPYTIHHHPRNIENPEMSLSQATSPSNPAIRDYSELRFRLSAINNYDGSPESLNNYIFSCRQVTDCYANVDNSSKALIINHLKAKLTDRASLQLGTRNYLSFELFYEDLRSSFSLGKDLNSYRSDILNAHKKSNQPLLEFSYYIRKLLDLAYDYVQSSNYPPPEMITIKRELDCIAIEKIIASSHHDLQRHFFSKPPFTITEIINEIQRDIAFTQRAKQNGTYFNTPPRPINLPQPRISQPMNQFSRQNPLPTLPRFQPNTPIRSNLPPKPQFNNNYQRNSNPQSSGRYANVNSHRTQNNFYPKPPTFNSPYNPSTRPPHYQSNVPRQNFNNFQNNFQNKPPPRPNTQHPPTPMDINTHQDEYNYDHYSQYPVDSYYEESYEQIDDFNPYPYFDENLENQYENPIEEPVENFPAPASETSTPEIK